MWVRKSALFWLIVLLLGVLGPTPTWRQPGRAAALVEYRTQEMTVTLQPGSDIEAFNAQHNTYVMEQLPGTDSYLLGVLDGAVVTDKLAEVTGDQDLLVADRNYVFKPAEIHQISHAFLDQISHAFLDTQSPVSFYGQPMAANLRLAQAQNLTQGAGVRVAVIDTGIDMNHPLFAGRIAGPIFDFVDNDGSPQEEPGGNGYGHGTFVAGLIALTAPQATIMPLRAFDKDGIATSFTIAKAIRHAADNGAQVINLSFGLLQQDTFIKDVLSYAYARSYMVAAAGNDNQNTIHFPATHKSKTLGVTSVTDGDLKAAFSNYNADVQVAAPGVNLYSAYPGNRWAWWSGTSFSTALVSGEAALILSLRPSLNRSAVNSIITSCGKSINSLNPAYNGKLGKVRIDYLTAVNQTLNRK